ncbi:MAG: Gfo/Idh/MocA family oxidoreductase [Candidatus Omnitrophica bacterium]|nr:Gfo/Idh/MocA family oxidoreductase [Candidatus Omnitrophota bacterium]
MRIGIIGLGKIGSLHLKVCRQIKGIKKLYLVDIDKSKLLNYPYPTFSDYRKLKDLVDGVIIATPTSTHFPIASFFLKSRMPVLVEKPLTPTLKEARSLVRLAKERRTLLFVGHVERYNAAYISIRKLIKSPRFIECHRLSSYPYRSLDISVVLDLMIHDLDIILDITKDRVKKIEAIGVNVLSPSIDIANVRLTFEKGCVANITASRISKERIRKFRVFSHNTYISLDYANQIAEIYQKKNKTIQKKILKVKKQQPLERELREFMTLVKKKRNPLIFATKAKNALELALKIQKVIEKNI